MQATAVRKGVAARAHHEQPRERSAGGSQQTDAFHSTDDAALFAGEVEAVADAAQALENVADWGLHDTFRRQHDVDGMFSYYDYTAGRFHKREGIRIDYLLSTADLADTAVIDLVGRKGRVPGVSDPLVAQPGARARPKLGRRR